MKFLSNINNYSLINIKNNAFVDIQIRNISSTKILEKGRRSRIKLKRKKTADQKETERWKIDKESSFSAVPIQYAERKKLEHEELQQEEARKLTKEYTEEQLKEMKPKQLFNIILRQSYAFHKVNRSWLDIFFENMDHPEQITQAITLILKFQTSGWFGDYCVRLPEQVVDASIRLQRPDWALDFLRDNMTFRFFPSSETLQKLMSYYNEIDDLAGVLTVWQLHKERGYSANVKVVNCLLNSYIKANEFASAAWVISKAFQKKSLFDENNLRIALTFLVQHPEESNSQSFSLNNVLNYIKENQQELGVLSDSFNGLLSLSHLRNGKVDPAVSLTTQSKDLESFFQSFTENSSLFSDPSLRQHTSNFLDSLKSKNVNYPDSLNQLVQTPTEETQPETATETPSETNNTDAK